MKLEQTMWDLTYLQLFTSGDQHKAEGFIKLFYYKSEWYACLKHHQGNEMLQNIKVTLDHISIALIFKNSTDNKLQLSSNLS